MSSSCPWEWWSLALRVRALAGSARAADESFDKSD